VSAAHESVEECSDGVAMAQVLHVLAPDSFDSTWLSKVSTVGDNKRLKLANLRKVLTGTLDYLKDVVGMQLSQFPLPDINKVVECDPAHLGRLLQLILGVAINCSFWGWPSTAARLQTTYRPSWRWTLTCREWL